MQLTERDIEIMKFINEFGYCEMPQIEKKFNLKKPRSYKVIKRLVDAEYIYHQYMLRNNHGIYRLGQRGTHFSDLPMLKYVSLGSYLHQIAVVNVYLDLMKRFPESRWISERRLKRNKFLEKGFSRNCHIADGMLILSGKRKIAVEVELTMKGKDRLKKILRGYYANFDIDEVWYFCPSSIRQKIKNIETTHNIYFFII